MNKWSSQQNQNRTIGQALTSGFSFFKCKEEGDKPLKECSLFPFIKQKEIKILLPRRTHSLYAWTTEATDTPVAEEAPSPPPPSVK